jgi:ceramide glucosyltransferase
MAIDFHFLPSVLVGRAVKLAQPCFGSTIALTRETLARVGGFEAFGEHLADDYAIGDAIRRLGLKVAMPDGVVAHACTESSLRDLVQHELRWARTVRAVDPAGFAGSLLTHPIPLALIAAAAAGFSAFAWARLVAAVLCRLVLQRQVDHTLVLRRDSLGLALLRDFMSFAIFIASFFVSVVRWRGRVYAVRSDGTLAPVRETRA